MRLPPIDWSDLPLSQLVWEIVNDDHRNIIGQGVIHDVRRPDLELAWTEVIFIDPHERREARSRICLGRGSNIQALITLDFWRRTLPASVGCGTKCSALWSWAYLSKTPHVSTFFIRAASHMALCSG